MGNLVKAMFGSMKTSVGGLVALSTVGLLVAHRIDTNSAVALLGVAGGWIGLQSQDTK